MKMISKPFNNADYTKCHYMSLFSLALMLLMSLPVAAQLSDPVLIAANARNLGDEPWPNGNYEVNRDGEFVVFFSDDNRDGAPDLFSVPIAGGTPIQIDQGIIDGGASFLSESDGEILLTSRVLGDLYYLSEIGSDPIKVNSAIGPDKNIFHGEFSQHNEYIVYKITNDRGSLPAYQSEIYSIKLKQLDDDVCFPVKAANKGIAVICL